MKRAVVFSAIILPAVILAAGGMMKAQQAGSDTKGQVTIVASPGMNSLASMLGTAYGNASTDSKVIIKQSTDPVSEVLSAGSGIAIVSGEGFSGSLPQNTVASLIGRDVIVPVVNSSNPVLDLLKSKGLSSSTTARILTSDASVTWGSVAGNENSSAIVAYGSGDAVTGTSAAEFCGVSADAVRMKTVNGDQALVEAIRSDRNAIGFCRLSSVTVENGSSVMAGVTILPVDRNGNGQIDFQEAIYDDINSLTRGVWIGKYPKSLVNGIYAVMPIGAGGEYTASFMKWILTDGQKLMASEGHTELLASERLSSVDRIARATAVSAPSSETRTVFGPVFVIALVIIALIVAFYYVSGFLARRKYDEAEPILLSPAALVQEKVTVPAGIYFDKTHTWAFMDQEGIVTTGVDDFLQHVTGKITRLKMKNTGVRVKRGERFLSVIQNGKQLDLYAPVSGTIVDVNTALEKDASALNNSPYKEGWIYKIEPSDWLRENPLLFMADRQKNFLKKEFSRLRDFLASSLQSDAGSYAQVVLQDGGEIRDGVLSSLGPEVWEEFQSSFIDPSRQVWFYEI